MGKKVIITGVPGVGKTTVVNEALKKLKDEGIEYQSINFGTFMFDVAVKENIVKDRDQMRSLDRAVQKKLQQSAGKAIAKVTGNVLIDTHASVKTPGGIWQDSRSGYSRRSCRISSSLLRPMMTRS